MVTFDRRTLLKTLGSAAGLALVGGLGIRAGFGADNFLDRIIENDANDPSAVDLAKVRVGIRKVAENLYVLLGAGGNIGLFDGPDGAVVIDSGYPDRAKDVAAAVKIVAKNPANLLINTHYHFDHTGANELLHDGGLRIVAQEKVRQRLSQKITNDFLQMTFEPKPEGARPAITFKDDMAFYVNGDTLRIGYIGVNAHTDGDTYVRFEKANVLQTGDLFFTGFYPFIDYAVGGSLDGMITAEQKLLGMVDDKTRIIPGHGAVSNKAGLQEELDMLRRVRDIMQPQCASGKTMDEVLAVKPLSILPEKFGKGFLDTETFTKLIYVGYAKGKRNPSPSLDILPLLGAEMRFAVGAEREEGAAFALRIDGLAGFAAVVDEEDVHFVAILRRDGGLEEIVGFLGGDFWPDPFQAAGDAVDVRVDGEDGHGEGEEKEAVDSFRADAFELLEVGDGVVGGEALEEFEGDAAALGAYLAEDRLDARGLEAREAGDADPAFHFLDGGVGDFVPGFEAAAELAIAGLRIFVGGVLREDGFDEDIDAFAPGARWARAVGFAEAV